MHVSSSGLARTGYPVPSEAAMRTGVLAWIGARLDALFLSKGKHEPPPAELSRYRVVAIAASTLLLLSVGLLLSLRESSAPAMRQSLLWIGSLTSAGHVAALVLLRARRSYRLPALILCVTLLGGYIAANLALRNPFAASHVATPLITLLAFFLLGARQGFVFAAFMSLYAVVLQPLLLSSNDGRWRSTEASSLTTVGDLFVAFCIMGVWGLSWLHSRARDRAQEALEQTLRSLHDSERKLSSVVESTEDLVCSLDTEGHLLTANAAMRRWYSRIFGQEPRLGERLATASPRFLEQHPDWPESFRQALQGRPVRLEGVYPLGDTFLALDFSLTAIPGEDGAPAGVTIFGRDITARRQAEARVGELHRTLLETSRMAGMAEIATGVLHNVGNTLNSINVSASLIAERLTTSRVPGLVRATELMEAHATNLGAFLAQDEKGRLIPQYLQSVAKQLSEDQATLLEEVHSLSKNVEHIRSVVSTQQDHARFVGAVEQVELPELIDDALRLHATSFERLGIQVRREYAAIPPIMLDRHKLLQILVNLLSNARHALLESPRPDKQLTLRIGPHAEGLMRVEVADNGVGIAPENLSRIFTQGFTTKRDGHGFGMHASALAATEMKGRLLCTSAGRDMGATFIIELPLTSEQARA
jgi:two-component system sensor kinase FixL